MKLGFDIEAYPVPGKRAGLYTVRLHGETVTELDRFLTNPENQANADYPRLRHYLRTTPTQGFREGQGPNGARFRPEDDLLALSVPHPDYPEVQFPPALRLFCLRYGDVVVLGSGGVKRGRTLKEFRTASEEADRAVRVMKQVRARFEARMDLHEIAIQGVLLKKRYRESLSFHPDDIP